MDAHFADDHDSDAARTTNVIAHLEGALQEQMLVAMQDVWSMLEHASTDAPAHARAVRARMFWETLSPVGHEAAPTDLVLDLTPSWDAELEADAA